MGKKLPGKALAKFEAKRDVWQEVLDSVREIKRVEESGRRWEPSLMSFPRDFLYPGPTVVHSKTVKSQKGYPSTRLGNQTVILRNL